MARDNNLPGSSVMARVSPRFGTPLLPAVLIGVLAVGILVININQPQIFSIVTSLAIVMIYMAYLLVTAPMLVARIRGRWSSADALPGRFSLGRFGFAVNLLAVLWGFGMTVNLAWPRLEVYNATEPHHWYLQWGAILFIGIVGVGGFAYYWFVQRHPTGVLAEHAAPAAGPEPSGRHRRGPGTAPGNAAPDSSSD
jgi:amino acid transporter